MTYQTIENTLGYDKVIKHLWSTAVVMHSALFPYILLLRVGGVVVRPQYWGQRIWVLF